MQPDRQRALIDRIMKHRSAGRGTDTCAHSLRIATTAYTDTARLAKEVALLRRAPVVAGLSGLLPEANTLAAIDVAGVPVLLTRDTHGMVHAMLNVCRHRGAALATGRGTGSRLVCPYHGWTYELDGRCASRRLEAHFDDNPADNLKRLPVLEQHGLIWVCATPDVELSEQPLQGAELEIAPLGFGGFRLFASTSFSRPINWKLAVDTFCEAYHVPALHRDTLSPMIHGDFALFDAFGDHGRMVAVRKSVSALDAVQRDAWSLLPHATILWFLQPNTVLIYQQDHAQLYQATPGSTPGEAHLQISLYVPDTSEVPDRHWQRNFELLVEVTDQEDFSTAASIQRGVAADAQTHLTFGRNEPALQHFHQRLDALL